MLLLVRDSKYLKLIAHTAKFARNVKLAKYK